MKLRNILRHPETVRRIARASRPGVVLDFDGTVAETAANPRETRIHPRAAAALGSMVATGGFALIAVLSGRAVRDVAARAGIRGIVYVGNHGAEYWVDGVHRRAPNAAGDADVVAAVVGHLRRTVTICGLHYEDKGFTASVHFRQATDPADAERRLLAALSDAPSMESFDTFRGKMLLEIRPARAIDKGDALAALAAEHRLDALLFVGDDTTDVDGMRRLAELPVATVGVAVVTADTPAALAAAADYGVSSVTEVVRLLELLDRTVRTSRARDRTGVAGV